MHHRPDLIGHTFNYLTVLTEGKRHIHKGGTSEPRWKCLCVCGEEVQVSTGRLHSGAQKSCGCMNFTAPHANIKQHPTYTSLNSLLNRYRQTARKRELTCNLKLEEFAKIISESCVYCGVEPFEKYNVFITKEGKYRRGNTERMNKGWILYNGIDRVDNNLGYVSNNIVPCCKWCNYAKNDRSLKDFIAWTKLFRDRSLIINQDLNLIS